MKIKILQEIWDKIRNKPTFTKLLVYKYFGYLQNAQNVHTLILGSSHLANGYYPQEGEYNFALPSQDLYYAYNLYKKLNQKSLKNIIIAFSVFTPGLSIIRTKCSDLCVPYKVLMNINYQDAEVAQSKNLFESEKIIEKEIELYKKNLKIPENYFGNLLRFPGAKFNSEKAQKRALGHYKNNQREISQIDFCAKIIEEARVNNQKVYFVLPPCTKEYRKALPETKKVFEVLYQLVEQNDNAEILNYYDKDLFDKSEYSNEDHLNRKGAIKLAKLVREDINA